MEVQPAINNMGMFIFRPINIFAHKRLTALNNAKKLLPYFIFCFSFYIATLDIPQRLSPTPQVRAAIIVW